MKLIKNSIILMVLVMLAPKFEVSAQSVQSRFDEANNLAQTGAHSAAYDSLKAIEADGFRSGMLYYNLAVVSFHLDSLSVAKYYHLKSVGYSETREASLTAISYINSQFPQRAAELPELPWVQFFDSLLRVLGLKTLFLLVVVAFNLGIVLYMAGWLISRPRWLRVLYLGIFVGSTLFLAITVYIDYREQRYSDGMIIYGQYAVKELPDVNSAVISQSYEGYTFTIDHQRSAEHPGWLYVRMSNGLFGWLPDGAIRII